MVAYNSTEIKRHGTCYIMVQFKTKRLERKFFVVDQTITLIGLTDSIRLGLIMVNCFDSLSSVSNNDENEIENCDNNDYVTGKTDVKCQDKLVSDYLKMVTLTEYRELFSGIGTLDGEIKITLKSDIVPHLAPMRRVVHSLQEPLKKELDRLVQQGVNVPLGNDKSSQWCNSFVCVCKPNGKIRFCLNLPQLNKYIVHPHHSTKLVEDWLPELSGANILSIVDACSSCFYGDTE